MTERARPQRELVERLWTEGWTSTAIVRHLGLKTPGNVFISMRRARGYDLPYRRSVEQRERIQTAALSNPRTWRAV